MIPVIHHFFGDIRFVKEFVETKPQYKPQADCECEKTEKTPHHLISRQDRFHHFSVNVGQPVSAALELVGQPLVIHSQQV